MEQIHFSDAMAKDRIQTLFKSSRLIPFFGSGFTKDAPAKRGRVPDAAGLTALIVKVAMESRPDAAAELKGISSLKLAFGLLEMPAYITKKKSQALLASIFSEVDLSDNHKTRLLGLDWPHIFSFNIDDAIERVSSSYKILRPNRKTSREFISSHRCLFKVHGDISEFCAEDDSNLIFTWRDYAHSIESNKALLGFLEEEAQNSSLLFIGCSLDAEMDLMHLTKNTPFSKSIFIKRGKATLSEEITLRDYGIETVIFFDNYNQIYEWIFGTLQGVKRTSPTRDLGFNDSRLTQKDAIKLIASGGPVYQISDGKRIARSSSTFAPRTLVNEAVKSLRNNQCLLVTGKRFSGKTIFAFQLALALKEYGITFWGSTDSYSPSSRRELQSLQSHIFLFDSNSLDHESSYEVLKAEIQQTSRIVFISSNGDAESLRHKLVDKQIKFEEISLKSDLDNTEAAAFRGSLSGSGLPLYKNDETLLSFAFRCYEEFKGELGNSELFSKSFANETYLVLILIAAFGGAEKTHIDAVLEHFDVDGFVKANDRMFEIEYPPVGSPVLTCNSPVWLLKAVQDLVHKDKQAYKDFVRVIVSLESKGFSTLARDLIRFDKLNELSGGGNVKIFIRSLYTEISEIYKGDSHYWLQRAKAELISAQNAEEIADGVRHAKKVRLDTADTKNRTYFSATLVLTQLFARGYKITKDKKYLVSFVDPCYESISNYANNRRHVDDMAKVSEVRQTVRALRDAAILELLPQRERIQHITSFFG